MSDSVTGPPPADTSVPVLFIGGSGRCGSTLLARILGQQPGVFAAGELRWLWSHGLQRPGRCQCGELIDACPVWGGVLEETFGSVKQVPLDELLRYERLLQTRYLPYGATRSSWRRLKDRLGPYPRWLDDLYRSIQRVTGCRMIVDASKDPMYAAVLHDLPSVSLSMVHLIRDPRAAAYSWQTIRPERGYIDPVEMRSSGPAVSSALWVLLNGACMEYGRRWPDRYLRLRYEDFVADPRQALERIGELSGENFETLLRDDGRSLRLDPSHLVWGNPNRFDHGEITIRRDDRWQEGLHRRDRYLVSALTAPLLGRTNYSLRPSATAPAGQGPSEG